MVVLGERESTTQVLSYGENCSCINNTISRGNLLMTVIWPHVSKIKESFIRLSRKASSNLTGKTLSVWEVVPTHRSHPRFSHPKALPTLCCFQGHEGLWRWTWASTTTSMAPSQLLQVGFLCYSSVFIQRLLEFSCKWYFPPEMKNLSEEMALKLF